MIRVHKPTVLAKDDIVRRVGELAGVDRAALTEVLRLAFPLWPETASLHERDAPGWFSYIANQSIPPFV